MDKFYKTACSKPRTGASPSLQGLQSCSCSENWKGLSSSLLLGVLWPPPLSSGADSPRSQRSQRPGFPPPAAARGSQVRPSLNLPWLTGTAAWATFSRRDHCRLGTFPGNTSPAPECQRGWPPLSLRHPHLRWTGLFQEGGAGAKVRTPQERPGPGAPPHGDALLRGGPGPG